MTVHGTAVAESVRTCIRLYLSNKRTEGFAALEPRFAPVEDYLPIGEIPDGKSVLKSVKAMITLIEGLLSGSAESIRSCLSEFWEAEQLANESKHKEWIGNRISRGLSYMFGGLVQLFIGSYVKAGVNLTIGYNLVRAFEKDVLAYSDESDSDLIRSLGLLTLGLLNFFAMIVPPSILAVSNILGIGPSRAKFEEYIRLCSDEKGIFSYMAKLIEVYSLINSKNFMFSKITQEEIVKCRRLMDECMQDAPNSLVIRVMNASVCLGEGRRAEAIETLTAPQVTSIVDSAEWATMTLGISYKLGVAHICCFNFRGASQAFSKAADSIQASDRWHYIPFMRALEGMTYLATVADSSESFVVDDIKRVALDIFAPTYIDRDLRDTVVLPGDHWGARMGYDYTSFLSESSDEVIEEWIKSKEPITDLLFATITCLYQFDKVDMDKVKMFLRSVRNQDGKSPKLKVVMGEYFRRTDRLNDSVAAFDDALSLIDAQVAEGGVDRDSIVGFSLVFQGAALCAAGEARTAQEVLADLEEDISQSKSLSNWSLAPRTSSVKPGNLVNVNGGEFELILSFRRNGLRRLIEECLRNPE
jgi:hypothetical protein